MSSARVVVLRDRIALESGAEIDFQRTDTTFEELIGDDYATSIGGYLHRRRYALAKPSGDKNRRWGNAATSGNGPTLTEMLYEHFTGVKLVQGLGQLYLRHCELLSAAPEDGAAEAAVCSAQGAYDCFDACRGLLKGRYDTEHAVNRFRRAEAVWLAAQLTGTANPFLWHPENKLSWRSTCTSLLRGVPSEPLRVGRPADQGDATAVEADCRHRTRPASDGVPVPEPTSRRSRT
jgi:hypothetical protein